MRTFSSTVCSLHRFTISELRNLRLSRKIRVEAPFNDNRAVWQHLMADQVWRLDFQMAPDSDPAEVSRPEVSRSDTGRFERRDARDTGRDTGPVDRTDGDAVDEQDRPAPRARNRRSSVPSWDEIVFGSPKTD